MGFLAAVLALNAALHVAVVIRFGAGDNLPFLIFAAVYAALAILVFLVVPYAVWAVLVLSIVGIAGLTATVRKTARDKTLDKAIWVLDAVTIVSAAYLLFAGGA